EDGIRDSSVTGVQTCALPISVHEPTGTPYETVTEGDGTFHLLSVRVGGPYTVNVNLAGFKPFTQMGIQVKLGEATNIPVQLQLQTLSETVEVRADAASAVFTPSHAG